MTMKKTNNPKRRHIMNSAYNSMIQRCYNPNDPSYANYGGRGIKVCDRWLPNQPKAEGFWNFVEDMGKKPTNTTLERIENDKEYAPWNCVWATRQQQQRNRRNNIWITFNGKTQIAKDWAIELGINHVTLVRRYKKGLPLETVMSTKNFRGKGF